MKNNRESQLTLEAPHEQVKIAESPYWRDSNSQAMGAQDTPKNLFGNPERKVRDSEEASFKQRFYHQLAKSANDHHVEFSRSNFIKEEAKSEDR